MSYMRGEYYIYEGGDGLNIYAPYPEIDLDNLDYERNAAMSDVKSADHVRDTLEQMSIDLAYQHGRKRGHVVLPMEVFDALVAMRWAEMEDKEREQAILNAVDKYGGNFGSDGVMKWLGLPTVIESMEPMMAYIASLKHSHEDGDGI